MIARAQLDVDVDPGHGGLRTRYLVERQGAGFRASARLGRSCPTPGEMNYRPVHLEEELAKDAAAVETFLARLLDDHAVFSLGDLEAPHAMLHPTFFQFRFEDANGALNEFRYRIECGRHLDGAQARLVREFEDFFDSTRLVARYRDTAAAAERAATPRRWWKFWAMR